MKPLPSTRWLIKLIIMQFLSRSIIASSILFAGHGLAMCASGTAPFDPREATIDGVHHALFTGLTTCREVISAHIARIQAFNPTVNAIITLNPNALAQADEMDLQLKAGNATGPLFCIPVFLKDNYDTADMKTTGGCLALADSQPTVDAPTTAALKKAGAIILGKANLHELALEGISVSSLGGQTINPYDHTRTPGGSSGGSGVTVACSFAVFSTGTDTVNSLRSPASANSLVSIRPTRGLITRSGVIPISYTQDVVGPIARTIADLATALTVMASVGYDPLDNDTARVPPAIRGIDYSADLYGGSLKGVRLGVLEGFYNRTAAPETTPVNDVMAAMEARLVAAGAILVPITESIYNATAISARLDVQQSEYRPALDAYLSSPSLSGDHPQSFNSLYNTSVPGGGKFLVLPSQYSYVTNAFRSSPANASYAVAQLGIANLTTSLRKTFAENSLDALIYPEQKNLVVKLGSASQSGRNGILAALTGSPVVTVPAGFSPATADAPIGVPVGMEILGRPWEEGKLLRLAAVMEGLGGMRVRRMPTFANASVEVGGLDSVPTVVPDRGNIPAAYPIGKLGP